MQEWWSGLTGITQFFYGMAAFFSVFFLWQILAAFLGMSGDDVDIAGDAGVDIADGADHADVVESSQAFKLLSLRTLVTFFTLFSWGSALYTSGGTPAVKAMGISSIWGLAGMFVIASIFYAMGKLTETGTKDISTCNGAAGTVYLDIPAGGFGEIKTTVNGAVEHIKARSADGAALPAGTQIRVVHIVDQMLVEVEKITEKGELK